MQNHNILYGYIDITSALNGAGKSYTATHDCIIRLRSFVSDNVNRPYLNYEVNGISMNATGGVSTGGSSIIDFAFLRKGDTIKMSDQFAFSGTFTAYMM